MSKTKATRRAEAGALNLYPADASRGWRVIRVVDFAEGLLKVAKGEFALIDDEYGNPWYFKMVANFKTDQELPSGASSSSITIGEMMRNSGLFGKSRTQRLNEDERLSRKNLAGKPLPPEDAIERAIEKVKEWPLPHDDRALRVYPKPA